MIPQNVTQPSELSGALVGEAKLECSGCCHGIQSLQPGIVPEDVQDSTVGFPQELEPGSDVLTVNPILQNAVRVSEVKRQRLSAKNVGRGDLCTAASGGTVQAKELSRDLGKAPCPSRR